MVDFHFASRRKSMQSFYFALVVFVACLTFLKATPISNISRDKIVVDKENRWCDERFEDPTLGVFLCVRAEYKNDNKLVAKSEPCASAMTVSNHTFLDVFKSNTSLPSAIYFGNEPPITMVPELVVGCNEESLWVETYNHMEQVVYIPESAVFVCSVSCGIQQGIDLSNNNGRVFVSAGIYREFVNIYKPLSLIGAATSRFLTSEDGGIRIDEQNGGDLENLSSYLWMHRMLDPGSMDTVIEPDYESFIEEESFPQQSIIEVQGPIVLDEETMEPGSVNITGFTLANTTLTALGGIDFNGCTIDNVSIENNIFWNLDDHGIRSHGVKGDGSEDCQILSDCSRVIYNGTRSRWSVMANLFLDVDYLANNQSNISRCNDFGDYTALSVRDTQFSDSIIRNNAIVSFGARPDCFRGIVLSHTFEVEISQNIFFNISRAMALERGQNMVEIRDNMFLYSGQYSLLLTSELFHSYSNYWSLESAMPQQHTPTKIVMGTNKVSVYDNIFYESEQMRHIIVNGTGSVSHLKIETNSFRQSVVESGSLHKLDSINSQLPAIIQVCLNNSNEDVDIQPQLLYAYGNQSICSVCQEVEMRHSECNQGSVHILENFITVINDIETLNEEEESEPQQQSIKLSVSAISVGGNTGKTRIRGNTLSGAGSESTQTFGSGIRFVKQANRQTTFPLTAKNNYIYGWNPGFLVYDPETRNSSCAPAYADILLFMNDIYENEPYALWAQSENVNAHQSSSIIEAKYNYWGTADNTTLKQIIKTNCNITFDKYATGPVDDPSTLFLSLFGDEGEVMIPPESVRMTHVSLIWFIGVAVVLMFASEIILEYTRAYGNGFGNKSRKSMEKSN